MQYHALLEDLAKWNSDEYFYSFRYNWWNNLSGFNGADWVRKHLNEDEYRISQMEINPKTGELLEIDHTVSFTKNLRVTLDQEFKELQLNSKEQLRKLQNAKDRKSFKNCLFEDLSEVLNQIGKMPIEDLHRKIIQKVFEGNLMNLKVSLKTEIKSKKSKVTNAKIFYRKFDFDKEDLGNIQLKEFHKKLKTEKIIDPSTTYSNFKKAFTNEVLKEKIIWTASNAEFYYFMKSLKKNKGLFDLGPIWVSAHKNFAVYKDPRNLYTREDFNSWHNPGKELQHRINGFIEILEI